MKSIFKYALFLAAGVVSMTSCSNEEALVASKESGNVVNMVVTAMRESDGNAESRTTFNEVNGNLQCRWSEGDMLVVTNAAGVIKGYLTLTEGAGEAFGKFEGSLKGVDNGTPKLNYFYFGTVPSAEKCESIEDEVYIKDYAQQLGSFESLVQYDILSVTKDVIVENGNSYVENIDLRRRVSYARFNLNFPETAAYPIEVELSGDEIANKVTLNLADNTAEYAKGNVKATVASADKDLYITYLPTANLYELTFTAKDANDKTYTGKFDVEYVIPQGVYYRKTLKDEGGNITGYGGLPVDFTAVEKEFTLTYNANYEGSEDAITRAETSSDDPYTFTVLNYGDLFTTRTGYTFTGWNTQADGKGKNVAAGSSLEVAYPGITLYAQWSKDVVDYVLTYHQNWGVSTVSQEDKPDPATTDDSYTFDIADYDQIASWSIMAKPEGSVFVGWNTKADGTGTAYNVGATLTLKNPKITADLYAQWKPKEYTVNLKWEGDEGEELDQQSSTAKHGDNVPVNYSKTNPTKDGYEFTGWVRKDNKQAAPTSITVTGNVDLVFVPTWKKKTTITTPGYGHGEFNN